MLDPKLAICDAAKDYMEDLAQNFSLSVVLSGVNKGISQAATVHLYQTAHASVKYIMSQFLERLSWMGKNSPTTKGPLK